MTKKSFLPFLVMGLFVLSNLLIAQQPIIEKIVIAGNKRISSETILYYISSAEGSPFDGERLEKDFLSLWNTGFFDEVRILSEDGTQGKIVTFEVKEKMQLQEIVYEGNKSFSESDVTEKLDEQGISLKPGNYMDIGAVYSVMEVMRLLLAEKGLQYPEIKYEITPVSETTVTLTFKIDEGDKARIENIKFVGNKAYSDWTLKHTMKKTRPHWFISWASNTDLYSEERFSEDVARLTQFYWKNGYLRVKIDKPAIEVKKKKVGFFRRKESPRLYLTIPIEEGEQFRVGELQVKENKVFTEKQLLFFAQMKKNDVCDITQVQEWKEAIEEIYGSRGYIMVSVLPSYNLRDDEKLCDISLTIEENDIYYVNKIEFLGNYTSRDWVLRRQLILHEGQVFNKRILDLSVLRVQQLGFFDKVEPKNDILEEEKKVDVTIQVNEMGRNSVQFGGGYSALEGLFTNFAFETRNLLGRGQSVGVSGQLGRRATFFSLSFYEPWLPWLFEHRLGVGVSIFKRRISFRDFAREGSGGNVKFSWNFSRFVYGMLTYSYELINIRNPEDATGLYPSFYLNPALFPEGKMTTSSISPSIVYNTVDHPFFPTRGMRATFSFEYAGGPLRGTIDFIKTYGEVIRHFFFAPPRHLFSFRAQIAYAMGLRGQELPIFERYFLGGEYSIRGLELRTVSPRSEEGFLIGGTKTLLFNFEYVYLLNPQLRLVMFYDAGNAFDASEPYSLTNLRTTAGLEFRFFVPMFNLPMRLIWGFNMHPLEWEKRSNFQFSVGSFF